METTAELDTTTEDAPSPNGHNDTYLDLDDDAFLAHILAQKPAEEIIEVPEWRVNVLCRALNAKSRVEIQMLSYDEASKKTDYRRAIYEVIMAGSFNPKTGHRAFVEKHRNTIMQAQDGRPAERLFVTIMRLSGLFASDQEKTRKN